ncbi:MAG: hypothetical protein MRY79_07290 [Alphaproteobacteria bacterium]|nr:hypothetical protein [Alphaproteobacteria bacterium]
MIVGVKHTDCHFYGLVGLVLILGFVSSVQAQMTGNTPSLPTTITAQDRALLERDLSGVVRGFIWGLPPTVVLENERGQFMDQVGENLMYLAHFKLGEFIDFRSTIAYEFQKDQLWRVHVINEQHYPRPQDRIDLLGEMQKELEKKFGKPTSEEFKWFDERDKNWPQSWGWAVYRGDLFITIKWETPDTLVTLELGAKEELLPRIDLIYESRVVKETQTQEKRRELLQAPSGL